VPEYAEQDVFGCAQQEFTQIGEWLGGPEAAALEHAGLEEGLQARGRELERLLLQAHLDLRAAREQRREDVTGPDGTAMTRAEKGHGRGLSTVFGPVTVSRIAYRAAGAGNVHPADAALNLPPGRHSHGLSRKIAAAAADLSFTRACAGVAAGTGSRLGKRQCQELTRQAARDVAGFYAGRQPGPAPGKVLALSADGKGITVMASQMRPEWARRARKNVPKQDGRLSRGEVRNRKRMAEVAAVFDVTPVPRTPQDIQGPREEGIPREPGPQTAGKWLTASITDCAADVIASAFAEAGRRDPARERTWIALADGNNHQIARIRKEAASRGVTITILVDFIHVIEHLWTAAWCFFPEASPQAGPWVRDHATAILTGGAGGARQAAAAIRTQAAATAALSKAKQKDAAGIAAYLDSKAPYLGYPHALAQGWPIATGVIEGACRHIVKDRFDITGARWCLDTAEAILKLRTVHANGDLDDYWAYHLQQERQRNYGPTALPSLQKSRTRAPPIRGRHPRHTCTDPDLAADAC
jgi:hypothetical protein